MEQPVQVRRARPQDGPRILELERELASFEKLRGPDEGEGERLLRWIFDERRFECLVAERGGEIVGLALYFFLPTSFRARDALYLEDLVVSEGARSSGAGSELFREICREAVVRDCLSVEWAVLDWNVRAIQFYRALGAAPHAQWDRYTLPETRVREIARLSPRS
jgi:ribosomal protein S18 acetylase RimI-like enzyme